MAKRGKKYIEAKKKIDRTKLYDLDEAIQLVLDTAYANFDETVDIAVRLGVDPRHSDQIVRGACTLPHGTGKEVKVLAFAKGEKEKEAKEAGADYVGAEEYVEKIKQGWLDFDKVVATPDMMRIVGQLGKILGPRGLMPNPKLGTVTMDIGKVIKELKSGRIEFRVDKGANVHAPMGKVSFGKEKLKENILAFMDTLMRLKPPSSKGTYIRGITLSSTMGPGVKVDPNSVRELLKKHA